MQTASTFPRSGAAARLGAMALTICAAFFAAAAPGEAGNGGTSMSPSQQVHGNCIVTVTQPNTITYDPIVANLTNPANDSSGNVSMLCTKGATVTVDLNDGLNQTPAGSYYAPNMKGSANGNLLQYFVYQDSAYTTLWGSTTSANGGSTHGSTLKSTGNGTIQALTLYIQIPAAQNVSADSYQDTMTATVTF